MCKKHVDKHIDEDMLGGNGYSGCFLACISSLRQEELIVRCPRGQKVEGLLDAIGTLEHQKITDVAVSLITSVSGCLASGNAHKLPSAAQGSV